MRIDVSTATDEALKCRALELLAYGVIPFEQWAHVFANPNFVSWNGLRAKAFSVWFPTMVDYLQGQQECAAVEKELMRRNVHTGPVFELHRELSRSFASLLGLVTIEEQLFIRDRRLQNVHGRLQLNTYEEHDVPLYDKADGSIRRMKFTAQNYRDIMQRYYANLSEVSAELLERVLRSQEFAQMTELYRTRLEMGEHFQPLIERLGVSAACGSE